MGRLSTARYHLPELFLLDGATSRLARLVEPVQS